LKVKNFEVLRLMTEKVGIYVRVSTEEQAKEGISIDAQIDRCKAFCKARSWKVFKIYTDAGYSAGSLDRPALKDLVDDIKNKKFNILLVYKIDRFSRKLKDLISALEDLKSKGINFTSVTEQIDTTTAMGEAFFQIIGVFAQLERGMVKERVELAFDKKVSSGEALNRAPMGYLYRNGKLVVNEEEAEKVREIFNMWASGVHYKEIAKKFNIPVSTLYEVIKNPTYIGKVKYRDKLYNGAHKGIINEDLFKRINEK
jgi:site-specific DNA recombinase